MGRGISWKVASMHPDRPAEFHEVGHWRGLIAAAPGYMAARSCIGVNDSSVSVDNRPEAPRLMIYILVEILKPSVGVDQPGLPEAIGEASVIRPCYTSETL
jgi:hypothetical protein